MTVISKLVVHVCRSDLQIGGPDKYDADGLEDRRDDLYV